MTLRNLRISYRRRKRIIKAIKNLFNPYYLLLFFGSVLALIGIFTQPTPIWQYLIGLPLALFLLYFLFNEFVDIFKGETIFIISEKPIEDVTRSLNEGKSIAANLEIIDQLLNQKAINMLSSFWQPKDSNVWFEANNGIIIFTEILKSAEEIANIASRNSSEKVRHNLKNQIIKESEILLKSLEDIRDKNFRFRIYLHEPIWGGNITSYTWLYEDGYCLQNPQNVFK